VRYLRQVVPLGELQRDGKTVLITRMFGDDIEKLMGSTTTTSNPADLDALESRILALETINASLVLAVADYAERIHKLETGYQS
jgi:hypothetical protein